MSRQGPVGGEQSKLVRANTPVKKHTSSAVEPESVAFSDATGMDWASINSGRGVRVNVYTGIDKSLRKDWSQLIHYITEHKLAEVEVNLMDVDTLSLAGLGLLLLLKERKPQTLKAIKLCNCNQGVGELLEWTGLDKHFQIETTKISKN